MIVTETLVARHTETGESAFSISPGDATLIVKRPDGSTVAPTVVVAPGTSAVKQELDAVFSAPQGGAYGLTWSIVVGSSVLKRPEVYFACWTDVYGQVRSLIKSALTDAEVDVVLASIVQTLPLTMGLTADAPFSYNGVAEADRLIFDRALALMVAAWVRPFTSRVKATGNVVKWVSGTDSYQWQPEAGRPGAQSLEEAWLDEAFRLLSATAAFFQAATAFQNQPVAFRAAGRRRNRPTAYRAGPFGEPLLNPLYGMWSGWITDGGQSWWPERLAR